MDPTTKQQINAIKKFRNSYQVAVSHHNGLQDPSYQFHSNHLHLMVNLTTQEKHIQHSYGHRQLTKNTKTPVHSTIVKSLSAFINYLQKAPRSFLGTNSSDIKILISTSQLIQETEKPRINLQTATKQETKTLPRHWNPSTNHETLQNSGQDTTPKRCNKRKQSTPRGPDDNINTLP